MSYSVEQSETLLTETLSPVIKDFDIEKCRIPKLPPPTLTINFEESLQENQVTFIPNDCSLVFKASPVVETILISARKLTVSEDVKKTLELTLKFKEEKVEFQPGDSFGIICPNPFDEVKTLLKRLNILHLADVPANLQLKNDSPGKRKLLSHIPSSLSLKNIFLHCVELRSVPKKILLRVLAEYAEKEEKKCLLFLSSQEGSELYTDYIRKPSLSLWDILFHFKSCLPPVERILEYLPALRPRFYSVASSPLIDDSQFTVLFNVLKIYKGDGRMTEREGVCTGWLNVLSSEIQKASEPSLDTIVNGISSLNLSSKAISIFVYKRQSSHFYFPENLDCPVIMVGPGTGLAPFIGFLKHRENLMKTENLDSNIGETWLFYGCRYKNKDFLYKEELERFQSCGVLTHLKVSFSREICSFCNKMTKYVHENIRQHAEGIAAAVKAGSKIFVCGDAKNMAQDVQ
ncbi:Methionine synthase reductase, partial [Stegodyphus mimosarum]